ncbi:MAG: hypothetical protein IPG45_33280 [Deltaproteobacteria bacterium]|nr:hypothetical protein [Deltaproteobacteria bacterium]
MPPDLGVADSGIVDGGTLIDAVPLLAAAQCAHDVRCAPASLAAFGMDEADCVALATESIGANLSAMNEGVAAGRVTFDPVGLVGCLDRLQNADCDLGLEPALSQCRAFLVGNRTNGQGCRIDHECQPTAYCETGASAEGCVWSPLFNQLVPFLCLNRANACGSCTPYAFRNAPCYSNQACAPDSVCRNIGTTQAPNFRCLPADLEVDEPCGPTIGRCRHFLQCVGPDGVGTCQRLARLDETCDNTGVTAPPCFGPLNLRCNEQVDICVQGPAIAAPGESCNASRVCPLQHGCSNGTCRPLPGVGQPCSSGQCGPGASCTNGVCTGPTPSGGNCDDWGRCEIGDGCRGPEGQQPMCAPLGWESCP